MTEIKHKTLSQEIEGLKKEIEEIKIESKHCKQCNTDMREFSKRCIPHETKIYIKESKLQQALKDKQRIEKIMKIIEKFIDKLDFEKEGIREKIGYCKTCLYKKDFEKLKTQIQKEILE